MKKIIINALLATAIVATATPAFAAPYVGSADESGFTVTSDAEMKVRTVIADYDSEGRFVDVDTDIVDVTAGENAYTYAPLTDGSRKIMLWKDEDNSIEPVDRNAGAVPGIRHRYASAMHAAVDNGLIDSFEASEIDESITEAEVASMLMNALGEFDIDSVVSINPQSTLTGNEMYTILAKVLKFDYYTITYASGRKEYIGKGDSAVLDNFADKDTISSSALDYVASIVDNGGFEGFDGLLKGDSEITKGEFAYIMDSLIGTYIDEPGTYTANDIDIGKSVIIRNGGVTLDGLITDRNIIVGYSVDTSGVTISNAEIIGVTAIFGGADPEEEKARIKLHGVFADARVGTEWVVIDANSAKIDYYRGIKNSIINMGMF